MPCLQFQMFEKKAWTAGTASSRRLSASHNALPDHQRETKMANVLGENEPFVIFWRRHEPRKFSRHTFEINSAAEKKRDNSGHSYYFILSCESFVEAEGTEWGIVVMMFSSCGGVWVRRSATCPGLRLRMWINHADDRAGLLDIKYMKHFSSQPYLKLGFYPLLWLILIIFTPYPNKGTDGLWLRGKWKN